MPPTKGGNAKKETGRAKKEENEIKKKEAASAAKEKLEAEDWGKGAKNSKAKEDKEAKKAAEAARKAENARLLAEEEASTSVKKVAPKAGAAKKAKPTPKPAGPGALAAGGGLSGAPAPDSNNAEASSSAPAPTSGEPEPVESFTATGIDDALEMLSIVTAKTDKASVGQAASKLDSHPERRFKAAFEAYKERELPGLRKDYPGLRLQQYQDMMYKNFQKSPDNPFNQVTVAYDASKDDKVSALDAHKKQVQDRLREK